MYLRGQSQSSNIGCLYREYMSSLRPYCHFCLHSHSQHLNIYQCHQNNQMTGSINESYTQESKISLDNLKNRLIRYINFNIEQLKQLGFYELDLFDQREYITSIITIIKGINQNDCKQNNRKSKESNKFLVKQQFIDVKILQIDLRKQYDLNTLESNNLNSFQFELITQNSTKQEKGCYSIAINKDNSIVLAGCDNLIKVFENQQGNLNQIQLLSEHTTTVYTLNFMQKSNNFVSGSHDKQIIIWQMNESNLWTFQQILNGHSHSIVFLLINNNENLINSSSYDNTIKFWNKQMNDNLTVLIKFSEQEYKLIACSNDSKILVIKFQQLENIWSVIQKIQVDQFGYRLSFINENLFTFQPECQEYMSIYEPNSTDKKFIKTKEINVKCDSNCCDNLFPQKYIKIEIS
ncbi:unnamed protein product [Paramecium pentaurelia]|uniref:WD40-repeat-containing domain n=1 Tax=Paramecium pentaurelia TaxID=43138 RepID=A0A8S1XU40_9CILI|nr:unnamed protein product [Paramecium pentaurelia]